ncbi:unnamed protein product [Trichogramma brassicae]|uniref:Sulfhydryl oxidase n=1 Tax=Trichogramma brassicae TaxID=86971 RepID=A0A6H5J199_9HYME|nr:unnamed protein product [Trichogramma brassicae]
MSRKLLEVLILALFFITTARSNAIGIKDEDAQSLYNATDQVVILDVYNFKSQVYNSDKAWLVEFYNSWCGFCHRFAPIWKSLAKSVHDWNDIVTLAVIDCANDDNNPMCREYEIMKYPTIKFFSVNSKEENLGLEFTSHKDEVSLTQGLIQQLEKEQQEQRGASTWPNIVPYRGTDLDVLWHGTPDDVKYQILIFEEPESYLGAQVILDLHKLDTILMRRVSSENELLSVSSKIMKFPSLLIFDRKNDPTVLKINTISRDNVKEMIIQFLKTNGVAVRKKLQKSMEKVEEKSTQPSLQHHENNKQNSILEKVTKDELYQIDLESALRYSLNNEISLSSVISGEKMNALKAYLNVLANYFPVYLPKTKTYLEILYKNMENTNNITGKEFKKLLREKESELTPIYSAPPKTWIGCKGSKPNFRGYPCGLWTMFHTLTVAEKNSENTDNVPSVLSAMHGYIKNFFGCADCSEHFQTMAKNRKIFEANKGGESVLWLWQAHNEVNERLAGDLTEDPENKKIQYPSKNNCVKCKSQGGDWDEIEVLRYLESKYSKFNINSQGIDSELFTRDISSSATNSGVSHSKFIDWNFTIFDMSICVVLYVVSASILVLVFAKFAFKRSYRKRITMHNLLG